MPTRNINLTDRYDPLKREELEAKAKLEALHREAKVGKEAYSRGETSPIEDDVALDRFFSDIAREAAGT